MTTCSEYKRWLSSYLDGLLEVSQLSQLEVHLKACPRCAAELNSLKQLQVLLRDLGEVEAPSDILAGVHAKLSTQPRWKSLLAWRPLVAPRPGLALALTAILIVFVVAIPLYMRPAIRDQKELAAKPGVAEREARRAEVASHLGQGFAARKKAAQQEVPITHGVVTASRSAARVSQDKTAEVDERARLNVGAQVSAGVAAQASRGNVGGYAALEESVPAQAPAPTLQQEAVWPAAPELKPAAVQLRWIVADRVEATTRLSEWLAQIRGATLSAIGDRLVVQLPESRYPLLLAELAKYGTPSRQVLTSTKDKGRIKEETNESPLLESDSKKRDIAPPPTESFVTVELLLVPSIE